jgi:ketosteroid isomerase-like protein
MTDDDGTRAIVRELYDAYGRRDFDRVAALIHDDIDWTIYSPVQIFPFAGARRGRTAVLQALGRIAELYALESYTLEIMIVDGDRAAVMSDISFTQRSTNRTLRFRVANLLRIQAGKVIEFREFSNTFDVAEQVLGRELQI